MKKDTPLEAIRGLAAFVVVVGHINMAFFPQSVLSWRATPLYVFTNGIAAVQLFFVLSAYVLTRRYFDSGDNRILLKGAIKRWPRLMGPVLLVVLASYLLFKLDLYYYEQAGAISGSEWLIKFGSAYDDKTSPQFLNALLQGAFFTFFRGDFSYDSSLWSMHPEFIGSFIAFGFAPILLEGRKSSLLLALGLIAIAAVLAAYANLVAFLPDASLIAFPIGVGLAALLPRGFEIPSTIAYPALLAALFFLGFSGASTGLYAVFNYPTFVAHFSDMHVIGATILIAVIETHPPIRRVFSGRISQFLGELSFPIYLVHVLVICSIGSAVYLWLGGLGAILAVFIFSILVSLPLIAFNNCWLMLVNTATSSMVGVQPVSQQKQIDLLNATKIPTPFPNAPHGASARPKRDADHHLEKITRLPSA
jgi:peptidoglycan/LPS O-acetylase OafA/YrhL